MADEARRIIRPALERGFDVKIKADASVVTDVDQAVERRLREMIAGWFPEHGVIGEEYPPTRPDSPWQWILDPIDGTEEFVHGMPDVGRHPRPAPSRRADRRRHRPSGARPSRERRLAGWAPTETACASVWPTRPPARRPRRSAW